YLAAEAMAALGIPTTRALAAVATGEAVVRERPEPGGILLRVGRGHVRVGTFEYFARRGDTEALQTLTDYVVRRLYPEMTDAESPPLALFEAVIERTAALVARWMCVGFIHGVMNTDNTSIAGETIDYGPFGFIDEFDPATCYSSIDRRGRYAWNQQPTIAHWNLARLGECLLPLLADSPEQAVALANPVLETFPARYQRHFNAGLTAKIGLTDQDDAALALDLLERMHQNTADFTLTFRGLCALGDDVGPGDAEVRALFDEPQAFDAWAVGWRQRLRAVSRDPEARRAAMRRVNPALVLRNHLAQRAVDAAIENLDFEPMHTLHRALVTPFDPPRDHPDLARPPRPEERVLKTFCGT
ncbi:MAG: protein adenylyltransferase SelO family protein, partial [Wenzhouxiangellaceae bacterium]